MINFKKNFCKKSHQSALEYHEFPIPGKISVIPSKQLSNQDDLALAYSPGVASACEEIVSNSNNVFKYTTKGNLVAVITNGTAVLGMGNIGPLASKPVMEGKAVLFKKFAGIDVFDLEINETDPDKLCDIIFSLEPTFGGINLEDIKAPECFYIEKKLRNHMKIPVFHDDQHGTAIIVGSAILNGLKLVKKKMKDCKLVVSGAGAAALACLDLIIDLGFPLQNIFVTDLAGVLYKGRSELMDSNKARFIKDTTARTLSDIIPNADIFLGLSVSGVLKKEMVLQMAKNPIILALANPLPEILPEDIKSVRNDAIIATGRSDYPNQVNNVLCFPYIFRGALDSGATTITREMEIAAVHAIADLAQIEQSDIVNTTYGITNMTFGSECIIPKPFDPRLMIKIAPAVAIAAEKSGVATKPIKDIEIYTNHLQKFVYRSSAFMNPIFQIAKKAQKNIKRIIYSEGEEEKILRAIQVVIDENLAFPILIGRTKILEQHIKKLRLRIKPGIHFEIIDPDFNKQYKDYWKTYLSMTNRKGMIEQYAQLKMRKCNTLIGAMAIHKGNADGMICGILGSIKLHLNYIDQIIGKKNKTNIYAAMSNLILMDRQLMLVDTHINENPNAEELSEITILAAKKMFSLGLKPRVALLSNSNFGSNNNISAHKMRTALKLIQKQMPELEIDGEMNGNYALNNELLHKQIPNSKLTGDANLLVLPNIESANIAYNLLKITSGNGVAIGPILLGCSKPIHILTSSATVRRIVNMTALCVIDALSK
ncbi:NADP-dependent malic enzyme [Candidatus Profftella armatura]|uniref:NADP-dependent malic enzyme n=1 Tax=Candidatus Profftella armatura TaxID=669502 RepID=UPI003D98B781